MDEYDDWFSDLEDDDLLALADLCEDDFRPDGFIDEDEIDLWEDEEPGDDRLPDAAEKDVAAMTPEQIEQFLDMILESPEKIEPLFKNVKKHPVYAQVKAEKKAEEKALLDREVKEIAMQRIEEAARTMRDFEQVIALWDDRDKNAARTRRNREVSCGDMPLELKIQDRGDVDLIFPEWMNDPTFRQIMRGNYLDYLYDCPYEMHDLTGQEYLRRPVLRLKEEHKEIIYFLYLRLYEPKDLAAVRGQTSRNIRKVRDVEQRKVRRQVYASLQERKAAGCSLTKDERDFLAECKPNGIKPPLKKHKKESA